MDVFYRLNPKLMLRYQPYMNEWVKERLTRDSTSGWITGSYVRDAIGSTFSKNHRYPDRPVSFYDEPEEEEGQQFTDADRFQAFATMFNKKFEEKEAVSEPVHTYEEGTPNKHAAEAVGSTADKDT